MKKNILLFGIITISCLLVSCGSNPMAIIYENDSKIASESNSFSYYEDVEQNIDDTNFTASVHGMDGMDTVWTYNAQKESEIQIDFDIDLIYGEAKVVFISPNGSLNTIVECSDEETLEGTKLISVQEGENRIKIVSRNKAKFDISLSIDEGSFEKLSF